MMNTSLANTIKTLAQNEAEWLQKFREENIKIFEDLPWEKTKYTNLQLSNEEMQISQKLNGFKADVADGVIFLNIFSALEKFAYLKDYFKTEENKFVALQNALF